MVATDIQAKHLNESLELCKKVTEDIIKQLEQLKKEIGRHHVKVLAAKTSGTTVTTLGTGLAVTGLIMAPFTLGASLIVSTVGAVTSVSGAAANMVTDLVDRSKKNKFIENIQVLAEKQKEAKTELMLVLDIFTEVVESLMSQGLSETQAIYAALHGDRCNDTESDCSKCSTEDEDFEWIENPYGKWKPIRKFCFKAGMNSLKLMKNSKTLTTLAVSGKDLAVTGMNAGMAGTRAAGATATASTSVAAHVGRFLGSTAFKGTMAVVGVVFTTIDVAMLVKEWKSKNPTSETIQNVIDEFTEEVNQYEQLMEKVEMLQNCNSFIGWIDEKLPVIGTSPFAVEAVLSIFNLDFKKVNCLYGDVLPNSLSDDPKLGALDIVHSHKFAVGPLLHEHIEKYVSLKVSQTENQTSEDDSSNTQSHAEPLKDLEELFEKSVLQNDSVSVPVFNLEVLSLYKEIIDSFLKQGSYMNFEDLRSDLKGTSVINDYDAPLPRSTVEMLKTVFISYYKYHGYLNANKLEFALTLDLLKRYAVFGFLDEYNRIVASDLLNQDDDAPSSNMDLLNELVQVLVNHKSYIDPVASAIWKQSRVDNDTIYNSVLDSVSNIFLHLQFKIPVWACELNYAIKKRALE